MNDEAASGDNLVFRVFNEIGILNQLSSTMFERVMPAGMTLAQFTVLNHLVRLGGPKRPTDLARAFQVTKATMTSTLKRMEAKGLVVVRGDEADGRGRQVDISEAGRAMRVECLTRLQPQSAEVLARLGTPLFDQLVAPLTELRVAMDRMRD